MRKNLICIGIIAAFIILQACSKKEAVSPIATGYEGEWTGTIPQYTNDSIQLNLKLGGFVDGKLFISPNGTAVDTVHGSWVVADTLMTITVIGTAPKKLHTFLGKANKNILNGTYVVTTPVNGDFENFHLARKK